MRIIVTDINPQTRASLMARAQEGARQAEIKRLEFLDLDPDRISTLELEELHGCMIGPGCFAQLEDTVTRIRSFFPTVPIAIVLENDIYASQAVSLRKLLQLQIMPMGDLAQIASFLIDCENQAGFSGGHSGTGVFGIAQLKGGVGATTLTAALASCWASHDVAVCAIDLDDVNPQLTEWARVGISQRSVTSEFLRRGDAPKDRLNEILHPVEGFEGRFVVVGQPERYNEGFHFKADILDGAPSSEEFVQALINNLKDEFDVILIDMGRSWGVASFAAIPLCEQVMLITDDDGMSVRRTLDGLQRLKRESNDPDEFDLARWNLILNGYTGRLISPRDLANEIRSMDLLPSDSNLYSVPFSEKGRQWGAPSQTMFELCEDNTKVVLRKIASSLYPFRYASDDQILDKLVKRWNTLVGSKTAQMSK